MSPDTRKHRGPHPRDTKAFAPEHLPALRKATFELSWLLSRDYASKAALKLVGDHYQLNQRQRIAVARAACSDNQRAQRISRAVAPRFLEGQRARIDGFNLLITVEAALAGGLLLLCRDGCVRDLASVHGTYRAVEETERALRVVGHALAELGAAEAVWYLDRPVSNSGRLAGKIAALGAAQGWAWRVEVVTNPDVPLKRGGDLIVTSDGSLLDEAGQWVNFPAYLVRGHLDPVWLVDLSK